MKNTLHQLKTNCNLNSSTSNNTPYRVIHQHRTRLGNPIRGIIMLSIIPLLPLFLLSILLNLSTSLGGDAYATTTTLTVDNSDTVLELTLPSSLTLDLTPSSTNNYISFGTSNLNILAGTNNPYGLTLTMSVPDTNLTNSSTTITNDETHNPNNIPLDSSNHPIIPTLSSGTTYTENTFTTNTWGYKLSTDTNYSAVPSSLELLNTDYAHNAITTTLNLAAKVDSTRLAGVYSAVLNFNMTANVQSVYRHHIIFNDSTFGGNHGCSMDIYTAFPDSFYELGTWSVDQGYIAGILYATTDQLTWAIGFDDRTFTFDSAPTLTLDQSIAQDGGVHFEMNGTVSGVNRTYRLDNIWITSDSVTVAE